MAKQTVFILITSGKAVGATSGNFKWEENIDTQKLSERMKSKTIHKLLLSQCDYQQSPLP